MVFETTVCIALSVHGIQSFALYLSASNDVAAVTQRMWKVSFCRENDVSFPVGLHFTGHWLDLHLLWTQLPTWGCFTRSFTSVVSIPSTRLKLMLDASLCHRCDCSLFAGFIGLDVLCSHFWRRTCVWSSWCWTNATHLDSQAFQREIKVSLAYWISLTQNRYEEQGRVEASEIFLGTVSIWKREAVWLVDVICLGFSTSLRSAHKITRRSC